MTKDKSYIFERLINLCNKHNYTYTLFPNYIYIRTSTDDWEITYVGTKNEQARFLLKHLNKIGKMHWHRQGKGNYNIYQIVNRITTHEQYCKNIRGY